MDLKCLESDYLRRTIFGNPGETKFDGWHLRGTFASRHFSYCAVQAILPIIKFPNWERDYPQQIFQQGNWTNQRPVLDDKVSTNEEPVFTEQQGQFSRRSKKHGGKNRVC